MAGRTTLRLRRWGFGVLFASLSGILLISPLAAQTASSARIVRLSFVDGTVNLQRPGVDTWAKAPVNTPIQQGFELVTDANSFAEVEFENGSTARLGQTSSLQFTELSLSPDGSKVNRLTLSQGYGTFTVVPERRDVYQVDTPEGSFTADGKATFRIDLVQNDLRLEVFKGHVRAQSQYGEGRIGGKHVLEIRPGEAEAYRVTHGITLDAWDHWVEQRNGALVASRGSVGYRSARAYGSAYGSLYGWNDLYYYGNWMRVPGYGFGWFPYAATGWMPYTLGSWAFYPGLGYTWISTLPWGWLPFHYGNWIYASGYGWGWMPGNFSAWSPAVVSWYQGSGWIGWTPYAGRFRTTTYSGCPQGQNCTAAMSVHTFQSGGVVSPNNLIRVNPSQGRTIASPAASPSHTIRLPGAIVSRPNVLYRSPHARMNARTMAPSSTTRIRRQTFTAGRAVAAPHTVLAHPPHGFGVKNPPGIVFNSHTHRYERSRGTFGLTPGTRGRGNGSNRTFRKNASRPQERMNRPTEGSAPPSQPSGGFGGSMGRSPGGSMQGNRGGGMGGPHSGSGGPHHH